MKDYKTKKAEVRDKAVKWQLQTSSKNYSYGELADFTKYFEKLGRKYGLLKEFRESC